ncbi:hypothetical protein SBA2_240033 [Acidobacteriia bacterium SbA2]|nr:hypothetical protein SBA2_240033 [Acidobacteriia bacterium SbA2]
MKQRRTRCVAVTQGYGAQTIFSREPLFRAAQQRGHAGETRQSKIYEGNRRLRGSRGHTHNFDVGLCCFSVGTLAGISFSQIIEGKFFLGTQAGCFLQIRDGGFRLSRTQRIDAEQQIDEVIVWVESIGTAQEGQRFSELSLLVKVESSLDKRLEIWFCRRNGTTAKNRNESEDSKPIALVRPEAPHSVTLLRQHTTHLRYSATSP